jgi:hypothetical protein
MTTRRCLLLPSLAFAALASLGCGGPNIDAICQEQEDCFGGNEQDLEACVIGLEAIADAADEIGCGDEFDAMYECVEAEASCRSESTGQPCMTSDECGGDSDVTCSGGECRYKYYGLDTEGESPPCEAESNAWGRCI